MSKTGFSRRFVEMAFVLLVAVFAAAAQEVGPAAGHLVVVGGAMRDPAIVNKFIELAGGPEAAIVIIPTAGGGSQYDQDFRGAQQFRDAGAARVTVLHTTDRSVADSREFVRPIQAAGGVFFTGGRQWRLADAYLNTRTHRALEALLERGGVIGGSSAGATILGSFLVRGDTQTNTLMDGDHKEGFGFLKNVGIDQHLLKRNRQFDLITVVKDHPELLGIGLDEDTAIVVSGDEFSVIGQSYVAIYDSQRSIPPGGRFYFLAPGDRYDLSTRQAKRPGRRELAPLDRVEEEKWP